MIAPKDTFFSKKNILNVAGSLVSLEIPKVMGVINLTPDSFYAGSRSTSEGVERQVEKMLSEGADFIDLGAMSSRPGAREISQEVEMIRLIPAIKKIKKTFPETLISVDTFRSDVAQAAVLEGAGIINDISGGMADGNMFETIASLEVPYILMHMRGTPETMSQLTDYRGDIMTEIMRYFSERLFKLRNLGVKDVILDPGFGFAKNIRQNFSILKNFRELTLFELPLMAGISRKSMIYKTLEISAEEALPGTIALNMLALLNGANILRVHDVKEAITTIKLYTAVYS